MADLRYHECVAEPGIQALAQTSTHEERHHVRANPGRPQSFDKAFLRYNLPCVAGQAGRCKYSQRAAQRKHYFICVNADRQRSEYSLPISVFCEATCQRIRSVSSGLNVPTCVTTKIRRNHLRKSWGREQTPTSNKPQILYVTFAQQWKWHKNQLACSG